jgi:hypothetical protein
MVGRERHVGFWFENLKETDYFEVIGMHGSIILKRVIKNTVGAHELDFCRSRQGQVADSCEHSNESVGSIQCGKFLD